MKNFAEMMDAITQYPTKRVAVAVAHDASVLEAISEAKKREVAEAVLVGDKREIMRIAEEKGLEVNERDVIDEPEELSAARKAVEIVSTGGAHIFMKGYMHTDDFLRAALDKEVGLRAGVMMSHVFILDVAEMEKLLFITDGAMNIAPDLVQKSEIMLNAIHLAHIFGLEEPKVGVLAAVELMNPKMPATVDATCLAKMAQRGQFSLKCKVDGPFALDNALSVRAAKHKKIGGEVAGLADILLVPNIEAGNILAKSYVYLAGGAAKLAGVVVGAKAPIVLTSRADSAESKLYSIAAAVLMADVKRALKLKIGKVHF